MGNPHLWMVDLKQLVYIDHIILYIGARGMVTIYLRNDSEETNECSLFKAIDTLPHGIKSSFTSHLQ